MGKDSFRGFAPGEIEAFWQEKGLTTPVLTGGISVSESMEFEPLYPDAALSQEEAQRIAGDLLAELGLRDFVLDEGGLYTELVDMQNYGSAEKAVYARYYILHYRRQIEGVTLSQSSGGKYADNRDQGGRFNKQFWPGELIELRVNDSGVVGFDYHAPLEITETVVEGAALKTFEKMLPVTLAQTEESRIAAIDRVRLSYSRISEKDSFDTGLLVPVWSFEGSVDFYYNQDNGEKSYSDTQAGVLLAVNAGESLRVTVTLKNASGAETMENILATAAPPGEGFTLLSPTDSFFWEALAPGDTVDLVQEYAVSPDVPAGQYTMGLSYDFAYHNGLAGAGAVSVRVNVSQPLKMEFPRLQLPAQAVVSDVVQVNVQAINLSHAKAYHVRATLEADGLLPSGTAYLGDLEGGASGEKPLQVTVTSLTGGEMPYGQTTGLVTYCYEDAGGTAYTQTASFTLDIASPFSGRGPEEEKDQPGQWWVIMGVLALALSTPGGKTGGGIENSARLPQAQRNLRRAAKPPASLKVDTQPPLSV